MIFPRFNVVDANVATLPKNQSLPPLKDAGRPISVLTYLFPLTILIALDALGHHFSTMLKSLQLDGKVYQVKSHLSIFFCVFVKAK